MQSKKSFLKYYTLARISCLLIFVINSGGCTTALQESGEIVPGAYRLDDYLPLIKNKQVGIVANHSSLVSGIHLVDTLRASQINVVKIFSPEHGFRGIADAGEEWEDYKDRKTGLPIISLYGSDKKPSVEEVADVEVMLFDLQDVGVRFYTYLSTLHYVMESCAENGIGLILLDRPNPNGSYIDGPVLETEHRSFVGLHPVPLVYGMTIGEYAKMINGEGWLNGKIQCQLDVIPCLNYHHGSKYRLPVNPSPNLKSMRAIYLYPSLGLFEGTLVSVGRGTKNPFTLIGHPDYPDTGFSFTPVTETTGSRHPKYNGETCYGLDLSRYPLDSLRETAKINLNWLQHFYLKLPDKDDFFNAFFVKLAGTNQLEKQIRNRIPEEAIRQSWQPEIEKFKKTRQKYLIY